MARNAKIPLNLMSDITFILVWMFILLDARSMPGAKKQMCESAGGRTPKEKASTFGILSDVLFKSKASRESPKVNV